MFGITQLKGRGRRNLCFSRPFNEWEVDCTKRFLACLHGKKVCRNAKDTMLWTMTKSGKFTVNSLHFGARQLQALPMRGIWLSRVQPKVSFFCMGGNVG